MKLTEKYFVKHESIPSPHGEGYVNHRAVTIFEKLEDGTEKEIGSYTRNYSSFYKTFWPFKQKEKEYALISKHYTCFEVIELPSCKTVAMEKPHSWGFCPVEFYVPDEEKMRRERCEALDGQLGFVAGCVWGDDNGWKIRTIDLRRLEEGHIESMESFGYFKMPEDGEYDSIEKCIDTLDAYENNGKLYCYAKMTGIKQFGVFHDGIERKLKNKDAIIKHFARAIILADLIPEEKDKELINVLNQCKSFLIQFDEDDD